MEGHLFQQGRILTDMREITFIYFVIIRFSQLNIHIHVCYDHKLPVATVKILKIDIFDAIFRTIVYWWSSYTG